MVWARSMGRPRPAGWPRPTGWRGAAAANVVADRNRGPHCNPRGGGGRYVGNIHLRLQALNVNNHGLSLHSHQCLWRHRSHLKLPILLRHFHCTGPGGNAPHNRRAQVYCHAQHVQHPCARSNNSSKPMLSKRSTMDQGASRTRYTWRGAHVPSTP